jgi:GntR family transcriptional regulator
MLLKDTETPLYIQLTDLLRQQIESTQLAPNQRIPSERDLCERYGVSRITVRQAMANLTNEGLITTVPGKGTYVALPRLMGEFLPLRSFTDEMSARGMRAKSMVLEALIESADDLIARKLHVTRGTEVVKLSRLRLTDGLPIAIQTSWLVHHLCPDILKFDMAERSLYAILGDEYQLTLAHAETSFCAALATTEQCSLLKIQSPAAVLLVDQTTSLGNGSVLEYTHSVYLGDRYTISAFN